MLWIIRAQPRLSDAVSAKALGKVRKAVTWAPSCRLVRSMLSLGVRPALTLCPSLGRTCALSPATAPPLIAGSPTVSTASTSPLGWIVGVCRCPQQHPRGQEVANVANALVMLRSVGCSTVWVTRHLITPARTCHRIT